MLLAFEASRISNHRHEVPGPSATTAAPRARNRSNSNPNPDQEAYNTDSNGYIVNVEMLSPALLKMSIKRSSVSVPNGFSTRGNVETFPTLHEGIYYDGSKRRQSAISSHSSKSDEDNEPTLYLRNNEDSPTRSGSISMGAKRRSSIGGSDSRRSILKGTNNVPALGDLTEEVCEVHEPLMLTQNRNFFDRPTIRDALSKENALKGPSRHRSSVAAGRRPSAENILELRRKSMGGPALNPVKEGSSGETRREIQPHQYTEDPTVAWEMLKAKRPVKKVIQMKRDTPVKPEAVRFVCLGCTHGEFPKSVPAGDVLIITGDFTTCGLPKEVKAFNHWLGQQKHAYKVIIAGNHECTFDEQFLKSSGRDSSDTKELALKQALIASLASIKLPSPRPLLTHAIYLQDTLIELFGITIYGTPWQPRTDNWAFNLPRGSAMLDKWNAVPSGVDVLITHTPPLGHGDTLKNGQRVGCVELLNSVTKRIKPKYHVFGHIHEGYGCTSDGYTKFINCCQCNENLEIVNEPVIFDIPVHPHTKQHYLNNVKKIMKRFTKQEK